MKKLTIILSVAAFLMMSFGGNIRSAGAQADSAAGVAAAPQASLLADNFESYTIGSPFPAGTWVNHNSSTAVWSIISDGSQAARQSTANTCIISNGNIAWTNYRVSAKVKAAALGFRNGIVGRFTSTSAYYSLYLRSTATGGTKVIELNKRSGSSNVVLQTVNVPIVAGVFYKLTLEVDGSTIKGYVDDVLKVQATDADYAAGKVGFYNTGDTTYDDLSVEDSSTAPAAPTNLAATGGSSQIALSWTAASGATGYNVKRATVDGGPYTTVAANVAGVSYNDTTVVNGTVYYYVVSAVNAAGESGSSNQASAAATLAVPGAPSALITASGDKEVKIYWTGSLGAAGYNVKRSLTSSGTYINVAENVALPEYKDTGLTNGTTYFYKISAVNAAGESPLSSAASSTPRVGQIVNVATQTELSNALNNAVAGDRIILADGNYAAFKVRRKYGTAEKPIVIKSLNPLGAVFNSGQLELQNTVWMNFENFRWTLSTSIKLRGTENNRLTRNSFEFNETGITDLDWVSIGTAGSNHNRVDHNDFKNKVTLGNYITLVGENGQVTQYDLIDHNYFYNLGPRVDNEKETIRLGDSSVSLSSGFTTVEYNLFEQCDGDPEILSIKTNDNIVRYNTFRRSKGGLSARQGNRNSLYGNFFLGENVEGTGGIRAYGNDHKIYNNYFEGLTGTANYAPIAITNGEADNADAPGADQSLHYRPQRIVIANNTIVNSASNIEIGGSYTLAPRDLTFANNLIATSSGSVVKYRTAPINPLYAGNIAYPTGAATLGITATEAEFKITDPLLVTSDNLQKLGSGSPAIDASATNYAYITEDFEGQTRDALRDVGADEFGNTVSPRRPLTSLNAGLNSSDFSISGRIVDTNGQAVAGVTVTFNAQPQPTLTAAAAVSGTTLTDANGYFTLTDVVPNQNYTVTLSKLQYSFNPQTTNLTNLSNDVMLAATATPLGPTAAGVTIAGRVFGGKTGLAKAVVRLTNEAGQSKVAMTNAFGYFSFADVAGGQNYIVSVEAKRYQFNPQVLSVTGDVGGVVFSSAP